MLTCSGKQDLRAAASRGVGAVKGSRTWAVGRKGSSQGLNFLMPSKSAIVSLQFHQCFAGRVSLTTLAVFNSNCYEFARCPLPLAVSGTFLVIYGVLWVSLSLSPPLIFCLHMSLQTLSLTVDIVLLMISPYGTNLILNLKICLGLKSKGVPTK